MIIFFYTDDILKAKYIWRCKELSAIYGLDYKSLEAKMPSQLFCLQCKQWMHILCGSADLQANYDGADQISVLEHLKKDQSHHSWVASL